MLTRDYKTVEGIRKLQLLIILLDFLPKNTLDVLAEWVIRIHLRHAKDLLRVNIDIPLGMCFLDGRQTIGIMIDQCSQAQARLRSL